MPTIPHYLLRRPRRARIVSDPERARDPCDELSIYCPCAEGLVGYQLEVLCLLPIHDANGRLLDSLQRRPAISRHIHAGIFAVDPFRRRTDILAAVRAAGFAGVANFPSVCRIDGAVRHDLETLGFGVANEVEFIREAVRDGFAAAAMIDSRQTASAMIAVGASVLIMTDPATEELPALLELAAEASVELLGLAGNN